MVSRTQVSLTLRTVCLLALGSAAASLASGADRPTTTKPRPAATRSSATSKTASAQPAADKSSPDKPSATAKKSAVAKSTAKSAPAKASSAAKPLPVGADRDAAELEKHLRALLDAGTTKGSSALQAAEKHWRAAKSLGTDARVDYAYGLVLSAQAKHKAAQEQFAAAVQHSGNADGAAWQALIWTQLISQQYDAGLAELQDYAKLVGQQSQAPAATRRAAAVWIGRTLEALDKCVETKAVREQLPDQLVKIGSVLEDELRDAFDEGRQAVMDEYDALLAESEQAKADAVKEQVQEQREEAEKIGAGLEQVAEKKAEAKKTVAEWKTALDEKLAETDKQIGKLQKDYQFLEARAQSLQQSLISINREMALLESAATAAANRGSPTVNPAFPGAATNYQLQMNAYQNQTVKYQLEYNTTTQQLFQVGQTGQAVLAQRAAAVKEFEAATGQLVQKNAELDKFAKKLDTKRKKLTTQPVGRSAKTAALDRKATWLRSYIDLDVEAEKLRLRESLGPDVKKYED